MGSGTAGCVVGTRILEGIGPPRKRGRAGKAGRKDWGRRGGGGSGHWKGTRAAS